MQERLFINALVDEFNKHNNKMVMCFFSGITDKLEDPEKEKNESSGEKFCDTFKRYWVCELSIKVLPDSFSDEELKEQLVYRRSSEFKAGMIDQKVERENCIRLINDLLYSGLVSKVNALIKNFII